MHINYPHTDVVDLTADPSEVDHEVRAFCTSHALVPVPFVSAWTLHMHIAMMLILLYGG